MNQRIKSVLMIRLHSTAAKALLSQNIQVTAFGLSGWRSEKDGDHLVDGLRFVPWERSGNAIMDGLRMITNLIHLINEEKPDVIHVNAIKDLMPVFIAARIANNLEKKRPVIIAMARHPEARSKPHILWLLTLLVRLMADGFVALSTSHEQKLLNLGVPSQMVTMIPNPYDQDDRELVVHQLQEISFPSSQTQRIVYVASLCRRKAQDVLIRAAATVLEIHPNTHFDLIGKTIPREEAYAEELRMLIKQLGLGESIHLHGAIPHNEVIGFLADCDIVAFPTRAEMMPRAVIEAMIVGKPVIASAVDGILDLIPDCNTGILVQPGDVDALAGAICELVDRPELASDLAENGQRFILEFCSPERVGRLFSEFYHTVAKGRR